MGPWPRREAPQACSIVGTFGPYGRTGAEGLQNILAVPQAGRTSGLGPAVLVRDHDQEHGSRIREVEVEECLREVPIAQHVGGWRWFGGGVWEFVKSAKLIAFFFCKFEPKKQRVHGTFC